MEGVLVINIGEYEKKDKLAVIGRISYFSNGKSGFTTKDKIVHTRIRVQLEYTGYRPVFVSYVSFYLGGVAEWYKLPKLARKLEQGAEKGGDDDYSVELVDEKFVAETEPFDNHVFDEYNMVTKDYKKVTREYKKVNKEIPMFRRVIYSTSEEERQEILEEALVNIFVDLKGDKQREQRKKLTSKLLNTKGKKKALQQLLELDKEKYGEDDYLHVFASRVCTLLSIAFSLNTINYCDSKFSDDSIFPRKEQKEDEDNNEYLSYFLLEAAYKGLEMME